MSLNTLLAIVCLISGVVLTVLLVAPDPKNASTPSRLEIEQTTAACRARNKEVYIKYDRTQGYELSCK